LLLSAGAGGSLIVVDLGSANGTFRNDASSPLPPNERIVLADGDRLFVGAWTRLTARRRSA
jgi:hypothetical protein